MILTLGAIGILAAQPTLVSIDTLLQGDTTLMRSVDTAIEEKKIRRSLKFLILSSMEWS